MTDLKKINPKTLLWVDLEMTGLDPTKDRIVEAAAIVTDWDFKELARLDTGVGQNEAEIRALFEANPWAMARPENTEELIKLAVQSPSERAVEQQVIEIVDKFATKDELVLLAGNSIHCDRGFIKQWWPDLDKRLHYRMLDVSAWKVVMLGKYNVEVPKKESHRALDDIRESIDELKFYLEQAKFVKR